jgi:hypothetical protein
MRRSRQRVPSHLAPLALSLGLSWLLEGGATRADLPTARTGPAIDFAVPPGGSPAWPSVCSLRHPVCVHAPLDPAADPRQARALMALAAADRAWDVLTGALALPPPDTDLDGPWSVYMVDGVPGGGRALLNGRDPRARLDRGSSFGVVDRRIAPGCLLDRALARALARAALLRAAPATDEGSACAQVEALARLAVPCVDIVVDAADRADADNQAADDETEFQAHPERTLVDPSSGAFERGASLFFDWLDATRAREPGGLIGALWALAPTRTAWDTSRWRAEPTAFDVLRSSFGGGSGVERPEVSQRPALDDVLVRFAVARARTTPPVRVAWHIPWPEHARRLASPEPVSPTGASYVLVEHAGAAPGANLRLEAQWEDYGRMRWVVAKLDAQGRPTATLEVTSLDLGTRASLTVESLDAVDRLLIVGVNVGSTEHTFDPDQGEWEPHGWLLTVEAE